MQRLRYPAMLSAVLASAGTWSAPLWIDVRSPDEYAERSLGSDPNIPHSEITRSIEALAPDRNTEIVLYCAAGGRSGVAKMQLESLGYTRVRNAGGIEDARRERGCAAAAPAGSSSVPCPDEKTR
jgi:phage shock protein E